MDKLLSQISVSRESISMMMISILRIITIIIVMVHFDENNEVQVQQSHPMETSLSSDRKLVDNYFEIDNGKDILRQSIEKHQ